MKVRTSGPQSRILSTITSGPLGTGEPHCQFPPARRRMPPPELSFPQMCKQMTRWLEAVGCSRKVNTRKYCSSTLMQCDVSNPIHRFFLSKGSSGAIPLTAILKHLLQATRHLEGNFFAKFVSKKLLGNGSSCIIQRSCIAGCPFCCHGQKSPVKTMMDL